MRVDMTYPAWFLKRKGYEISLFYRSDIYFSLIKLDIVFDSLNVVKYNKSLT